MRFHFTENTNLADIKLVNFKVSIRNKISDLETSPGNYLGTGHHTCFN